MSLLARPDGGLRRRDQHISDRTVWNRCNTNLVSVRQEMQRQDREGVAASCRRSHAAWFTAEGR